MKKPPRRAYDPNVTVASPGGKPDRKPRFRVLIPQTLWSTWAKAVEQAPKKNTQRLWDHLAYRPDQPPLVGTVTAMKGGHMAGKDGWSRVYHYELTGAGRVDYQFHPKYVGGAVGDEHAVVRIINITMSSH